MNAPAAIPAPPPRAQRQDGWTPDRRRTFLATVAEGHTVEAACRHAGLSVASAYALRRRDAGFATGWSAATLLARQALADILTSRAIDGQVDTYTRADGATVTRHRYDNRLAQAMLARLDRLAEVPAAPTAEPADAASARAVAGDFDAFLDLVEQEPEDAAVARFVGDRIVGTPQLPQLNPGADAVDGEQEDEDDPVWMDDDTGDWHTSLPPPADFRGEEFGDYGDPDYWRALTRAERVVAVARHQAELAAERAEGTRRRDAWFAAAPVADGVTP